jgi:hypothetical protein
VVTKVNEADDEQQGDDDNEAVNYERLQSCDACDIAATSLFSRPSVRPTYHRVEYAPPEARPKRGLGVREGGWRLTPEQGADARGPFASTTLHSTHKNFV